jgi:hypothetical protein
MDNKEKVPMKPDHPFQQTKRKERHSTRVPTTTMTMAMAGQETTIPTTTWQKQQQQQQQLFSDDDRFMLKKDVDLEEGSENGRTTHGRYWNDVILFDRSPLESVKLEG